MYTSTAVSLPLICTSFVPFLCYNRKAEVEQEPQKTKKARNLKSSTFTRMAQQPLSLLFPKTCHVVHGVILAPLSIVNACKL